MEQAKLPDSIEERKSDSRPGSREKQEQSMRPGICLGATGQETAMRSYTQGKSRRCNDFQPTTCECPRTCVWVPSWEV
jgi:hypothetical protein